MWALITVESSIGGLHFEGGVRGSGQWASLRFFDNLSLGLFLNFFPTALLAFDFFLITIVLSAALAAMPGLLPSSLSGPPPPPQKKQDVDVDFGVTAPCLV